MRHRFETKKRISINNIVISVLLFFIIIACFWYAISAASQRTTKEEEQTLRTALNRSITHCYAIEGSYPESLDYLKENYGLTYNEDSFYVDYQPLGSDIIPDVTIITKKGARQ